MSKNPHVGSSLDSWLEEGGFFNLLEASYPLTQEFADRVQILVEGVEGDLEEELTGEEE